MSDYLLIAEKPSLMRDIRACYNKHRAEIEREVGSIDFIALAGHVCRNFEPDEYPEWEGEKWEDITYPMVPAAWGIKPIREGGKPKLLKEIKEKAEECGGIIVATDSDVEGYGIYYLLEQYLHLGGKQALRFVEHSLTDGEILSSLLSMTDFHADPVHTRAVESFLIRSRADWLFGMNATRVMTLKLGVLMRVGRVKAPTIKLVYDNSTAIDDFKPQTYYQEVADYGSFKSVLCNPDGTPASYKDKASIGQYPMDGIVVKKETRREYAHAPKLFDLSAAQTEAGRVYGYAPDRTLEIIQSLYEKHKVISYPRTQCRYVSSEKAREFPMMLSHMPAFQDLGGIAASLGGAAISSVQKDKQVVNDAEVQKESHDALLPTSKRADPSAMTQDEKNICHMIYARLLAQFLPKAADDKTKLQIRHGDGIFTASGKAVAEQGWRVLYKDAKDAFLPDLEEGQGVTARQIAPVEKTTTPPKRLTQATLVHAMETIANLIDDKDLKKSLADSKGIGTPATRASIIKEIIKTGYIEDRKGKIYITKMGKAYIESLGGIAITSPEFAAALDTDIKRVQRGEAEYSAVYQKILGSLDAMCRQMESVQAARLPGGGGGEPSGENCPSCGKEILSRKFSYQCPGCGLKIGKTVCGKEITATILHTILSGKPTPVYTLKKKDGTAFKARFILADGELKLDFSSGLPCPACRKDMRVNNGGAFCECGVKIFRKQFGVMLTEAELKKLVKNGRTGQIDRFTSKKTGNDYTAVLVLRDDYSVGMEFPER